jgi:hypothetical protein
MKGGAKSGSMPRTRNSLRQGMSRRVATKANTSPSRVEVVVDRSVITTLLRAARSVRALVRTSRALSSCGVARTRTAG